MLARLSEAEWRETKYVKAPEIFNPESIEEEISMWPEWASASRTSWPYKMMNTGVTLPRQRRQKSFWLLRIMALLSERDRCGCTLSLHTI